MGQEIPSTVGNTERAKASAQELYAALFAVTDGLWGVNDSHAGDNEVPAPSFIVQARAALTKAANL